MPALSRNHTRKKQDKAAAGKAKASGQTKPDAPAQHPSASPLDPPGAIFEHPANSRGAAPYRQIVNRQVGQAGRVLPVSLVTGKKKKTRVVLIALMTVMLILGGLVGVLLVASNRTSNAEENRSTACATSPISFPATSISGEIQF